MYTSLTCSLAKSAAEIEVEEGYWK